MSQTSVHASAVVIGEAGVLLLGASGHGKSTLARALLSLAGASGRFAALVGDDRILLEPTATTLISRPHPAIAGMIEIRGAGILGTAHEPAAAVRLVVEITETVERMPVDNYILLAGMRVTRIFVPRHAKDAAETILAVLDRL